MPAYVCVCFVCVNVRVSGEMDGGARGCRNVLGSSAPAGTQLAIDGRTLRAVLEQPGRQAAPHSPTALASSLQTRGEAEVLLKIHSGLCHGLRVGQKVPYSQIVA